MNRRTVTAFAAGVLVANSAPHLATAATGRRHLTPLGGRGSGPALNAVWGALNLAGGLGLLAGTRGGRAWGRDLVAFNTGCVALATWMALSERVWPINSAER